jgi:hypothetical protein
MTVKVMGLACRRGVLALFFRVRDGWPMNATLIPIAAIVVSLVVAIVQYGQWRTANQKVVIDLYDRRLKVYTQLEKGISPVLREGKVSQEAFNEFLIGEADARFLFGDDVREYLKTLHEHFAWMLSFTDDVIDRKSNRNQLIDLKSQHLSEIVNFFQEAPDLFAPYMRLEKKNTPFWRPW